MSFAGELFFSMGTREAGVSRNGVDWQRVALPGLLPETAAYGNGRYVLVGNGPILASSNGIDWHETAPFRTPLYAVAYANDRFYVAGASSVDGEHWERAASPAPRAYVARRLVDEGASPNELEAWTPDAGRERLRVVRPAVAAVRERSRGLLFVGVLDHDSPAPEQVDVSFEDGLSCADAPCVVVGSRLYLVPPAGTPALPDRVPRRADGTSLLSDECPVSSPITCADYGERRDCTCDVRAPRSPEACSDVSEYACEGAFSHREGEWDVPELAQAGCSCTAIDPNQPPSWGQPCEPSASHCQAPLECLQLETVDSGGPSLPRFACTAACASDADCPTWQASGFCAGPVRPRCAGGSCQLRSCE